MRSSSSATRSSTAGLRLLAAIAAVAVALSACGTASDAETAEDLPTLRVPNADDSDHQNSEDTSEGDGPEQEVDPEQAMAEFEACMKEQGIDVSGFGVAGDGATVQEFEADSDAPNPEDSFDFESFEAGQEECDSILTDAFGEFEATPEQEAELADQMLEMSRCMAEAGFEVDFSQNAFELSEDIDFEAFDAAMSECQPDFESIDATPSS